LRLSGARKRVRCSRGFGALAIDEREALRTLDGLHREIDIKLRPGEMVGLGPLNLENLRHGRVRKPRKVLERQE